MLYSHPPHPIRRPSCSGKRDISSGCRIAGHQVQVGDAALLQRIHDPRIVLDGIVHFLLFRGRERRLHALQLFVRFHLGGRDIHQRRVGVALVVQHHIRLALDRRARRPGQNVRLLRLVQQHAGEQKLFLVVAGSPNRLINHPIFRRSQCVQRMVNGRGERCSRERKEESAKADKCRETKEGSTKRHFGITSGKGANTPPDTQRPSRWKER